MAKYAAGTSFLKSFRGYGVWRGQITAYDGEHYTVLYPDDGFEEEFDCSEMDIIMARSKRLLDKKVRVATKEKDMIIPDDDVAHRKPPPESLRIEKSKLNTTVPFQEGQRVWVVVGKERKAAFIRSIIAKDSATKLPTQARVKWTMSTKAEVVELDSLLPMSDEKRGTGKRNRKQTDKYVPPVNRAIKEEQSDVAVGAGTKKDPSVIMYGPEQGDTEHQRGIDEDDFSLIHLDPYQFEEGQHVWVQSGKSRHPAVIQSINSNVAYVRWTATNTLGKVERRYLLPMFEEENGESVPSLFSKRKRKETNRYTPPRHLNAKRVKAEDLPEVNAPSITHPKAKSVAKKKRESKEKANSAFVQSDLDTYRKVPSGVAPGPGWKSKWESHGSRRARRWISPQKEIAFKTPRNAFQFEAFRLQCGSSDSKAFGMYKDHKHAAGEPLNICTKGQLKVFGGKGDEESEEEESAEEECEDEQESEEEDKKPPARKPTPSKSPHPRYASEQHVKVSVAEAAAAGCHKCKDEIETGEKTRKTHDDLCPRKRNNVGKPPSNMPVKVVLKKFGSSSAAISRSAGKEGNSDQDFGREYGNPIIKKGVLPGPGWTSKLRANSSSLAKSWISPQTQISFKTHKSAVEFEGFRLKCNGDECQAYEMYWDHNKAAGRKNLHDLHYSHEISQGKLRQEAGRRISLKYIAKKAAKLEVHPPSLITRKKQTVDKDPADPYENMTLADIADYKKLYNYYLEPSTRENEEIPASGMILRTKRASCNLLRFKNSIFRQRLHRELLRLEKAGRKDEMLRMLRSMNDHDKGMKMSDGPSDLLDEILGKQGTDEDIEVLNSDDVAALQSHASISGNNNVTDLTDLGLDGKLSQKNDSDKEEKKALCCGLSTPTKPTALSGTESPTDVMDMELIDLCKDNAVRETNIPDGVGQHQAVQNVLQEWTSEEPASIGFLDDCDQDQRSNNGKARSNVLKNAKIGDCKSTEKDRSEVIDLCVDEAQKPAARRTKPEFTMRTKPELIDLSSTALSIKPKHHRCPEQGTRQTRHTPNNLK